MPTTFIAGCRSSKALRARRPIRPKPLIAIRMWFVPCQLDGCRLSGIVDRSHRLTHAQPLAWVALSALITTGLIGFGRHTYVLMLRNRTLRLQTWVSGGVQEVDSLPFDRLWDGQVFEFQLGVGAARRFDVFHLCIRFSCRTGKYCAKCG